MKIASFNINGIKARATALCDWLDEAAPDVALLQEIKSVDEGFPSELFEDRGYNVATHGQKSFNGVAILSKFPLEDITRGLPGDPEDKQARWIEATMVGKQALRICGLYLPNGNPQPGPKFDYKLRWMKRLRARMAELKALEIPAIVTGDFNVIPTDADIWNPKAMAEDALMQPESRDAYLRLLHDGWTDAIATHNPNGGVWTYWDYQAGAWQKDQGFRIDHALLSPELADRLVACGVDKGHRGREKASDHAPVWVEIRD